MNVGKEKITITLDEEFAGELDIGSVQDIADKGIIVPMAGNTKASYTASNDQSCVLGGSI